MLLLPKHALNLFSQNKADLLEIRSGEENSRSGSEVTVLPRELGAIPVCNSNCREQDCIVELTEHHYGVFHSRESHYIESVQRLQHPR